MFPRRPKPKRLVGDTPALRGRFRDAHPGVPITPEPGSAYRAWLNAQRRAAHHRPAEKRKSLAGDYPLLRNAFLRENGQDTIPHPAYWQTPSTFYSHWLRSKGIDPETGKMTDAGVTFFRKLLDQKNARKRRKREGRRRSG